MKFQNQLSLREVARSCGLPLSTVGDYLNRAEAAGLSWPLPEELSDGQLKERLMNSISPAKTAPASACWSNGSGCGSKIELWPGVFKKPN